MTKQRRQLIIANIVVGLLGIVGSFQACGPGELVTKGDASLLSTNGEVWVEGPDGTMMRVSLSKVTKVTDNGNVLENLNAIHGNEKASTALRTLYNNHKTKLSLTGKAETVNSPSWLALTNLSAQSCSDMIAREATAGAVRKFFAAWDFAKAPDQLTAAAKESAIRGLARAAWGRNETTTGTGNERQTILDAFNSEFSTTTVADTRRAALFLCTAITASLETHAH